MSNVNTDINKFDGKYLKCIVSKYKSSLNYLANTGALTIIQPNSNKPDANPDVFDINRNYVFLGDEFLASGYGFSTEKKQKEGERIVNNYKIDKAELELKISQEIKARNEQYTDIINRIKGYIASDGDISDTNIVIGNFLIPTKDVILYGEEAQYENLLVKDISVDIKSNNISSNKYNENLFLAPIGTIISSINITITTEDKDSGGLYRIGVEHNAAIDKALNNLSDTHNIISEIIEYNAIRNNLTDGDHIYRYTKTIENGPVISSPIDNVIKAVRMYVAETPATKYKYYPGLLAKNPNWKIFSTGNKIQSNIIEVAKNINVKPQYYLTVANTSLKESETGIYHNQTSYTYPLNNMNGYDKTEIMINIKQQQNEASSVINPFFDVENLYFNVPSNFHINKVYLLDDLQDNKYDWTGALSISLSVLNQQNYLRCPYSSANKEEKYPAIPHNIYKLSFDNKTLSQLITENITYILIEVEYDYDNTADDLGINYKTINDMTINDFTMSEFDEEFNTMHWLNSGLFIDTTQQDIYDKLKSRIEFLSSNGTK